MDIWENLKKWYTKNGISTDQFFKDNSTEIGRDEMIHDFVYRMIVKEQGYEKIGDYYIFNNNPKTRVYLGKAHPEDYMYDEAEQAKRSASAWYKEVHTGKSITWDKIMDYEQNDSKPGNGLVWYENSSHDLGKREDYTFEGGHALEFKRKLCMGEMGNLNKTIKYNQKDKSCERLAWIDFLETSPEEYDTRQSQFAKESEEIARKSPWLHNLCMAWKEGVGNETYYTDDEGNRISPNEHVELMKKKFGNDVFELAEKDK